MTFRPRPITHDDVDLIAGWHYPEPYDVYDPEASPEDLASWHDAVGSALLVAFDDASGALAGFVEYSVRGSLVEIGLGLRPDLTGKGYGQGFVRAALELARSRWHPETFGLDVLPWNERAITVYEREGFATGQLYTRRFDDGGETTFLRMSRPAR